MYKLITPLLALMISSLWAAPSIDLLDQGLKRFEIWIGIPHSTVMNLPVGTFQSVDVNNGKPMGLVTDHKQIFTISQEQAVPVLKVSGEIYGGLTTLDSFSNYRLSAKFKWGKKKWEPRLEKKRDSGILFHCEGPHGQFWNVWKSSLEYQVQESDLGDFIGLSGPKAKIRVSDDGDRNKYDHHSEKSVVTGSYTNAGLNPEKPHGEWNDLELYTIGQTAVHVVNGVVVMVLQETQREDGSPLTSGQIQIQSEAAECYYKEIQIHSISEFPEHVTSQIAFKL